MSDPGFISDFSDRSDSFPDISPDGSRLLFIRYTDDRELDPTQLIVANRDGTEPRVLPVPASNDDRSLYTASATWSADGESVYSVETESHGRVLFSRVVVTGADGAGRRVLHQTKVDTSSGNIREMRTLTSVRPSPDGRQLLLDAESAYGNNRAELWILDLATGSVGPLVKDAAEADWSPDGTRIVFVSQRDRRNKQCYEGSCWHDSRIYTMARDGTGVEPLFEQPMRGNQFSPAYSADGTRIAFAGDRNGSLEIYTAGVDGSCLTWLTNGSASSDYPAWGPELLDSGPAVCGAGDRPPRVDYAPSTKKRIGGQQIHWLGPTFDGAMAVDGYAAEGQTTYSDCVYFEPSRCRTQPMLDLMTIGVCRGWLHYSVAWGRFRGLQRYRGAIVSLAMKNGRPDGASVTIGAQDIEINAYRRGKPVDRAFYARAVRALRGAGQSEPPRRFANARLSRRDVRHAAMIAASVERTSVGRTARELELTRDVVRSYARFHRAVTRLGNVKTEPCRGSRRPGPDTFPFSARRSSRMAFLKRSSNWGESP